MKTVLLVYLPFCTPAVPPYSTTALHSFLKNNCGESIDIEVLDLNLEFHMIRFPEFQRYFRGLCVRSDDKDRMDIPSDSSGIIDWKDYESKTQEYNRATSKVYSENNRGIVHGRKPELSDELLKRITDKKPDIVAFSIVYSSQAFYAYHLMKELKRVKGVMTVIGGPAVNPRLTAIADISLRDELELLELILGRKTDEKMLNRELSLDFSIYDLDGYFTPKPVIPIKTSTTCYYRKCAYCSHFRDIAYCEYPIESIKRAIIDSGQKHFFLIDDMIPIKRLLEISDALKPLGVTWTCQLRPTQEFDYATLKRLRESGLTMLMWGVESGSDRVLALINKGTNVKDISRVLEDSHNAGIKNIVYIIFGFPTETKPEFLETIGFLERNKDNINLVSTSVFGLQKGTIIYEAPSEFGISRIMEEERTCLDSRITYEVTSGLTQEQANTLRDRYKRTIEKINKYPKSMNFFREHMLCLIDGIR